MSNWPPYLLYTCHSWLITLKENKSYRVTGPALQEPVWQVSILSWHTTQREVIVLAWRHTYKGHNSWHPIRLGHRHLSCENSRVGKKKSTELNLRNRCLNCEHSQSSFDTAGYCPRNCHVRPRKKSDHPLSPQKYLCCVFFFRHVK